MFDNNNTINYNQILEQCIQNAVEKALQNVLPVLMNLDNGITHNIKPTLTVEEAARFIGVSKPKMYELTRKENFPVIHIGKKILINRQALLKWMEDNYG